MKKNKNPGSSYELPGDYYKLRIYFDSKLFFTENIFRNRIIVVLNFIIGFFNF